MSLLYFLSFALLFHRQFLWSRATVAAGTTTDALHTMIGSARHMLFFHSVIFLGTCNQSTLTLVTYYARCTLRPLIDDPHSRNVKSIAVTTQRLTAGLSTISEWSTEHLVNFNASNPISLLPTGHSLPDTWPIFFNEFQLPPSFILEFFGLSFTKNPNWKFHYISSHLLIQLQSSWTVESSG